jgi:hypothetical protein
VATTSATSATSATTTVTFSVSRERSPGSDRYGRQHHQTPPEGPAQKSCITHLGHHGISPRRCTPLIWGHTRGISPLNH